MKASERRVLRAEKRLNMLRGTSTTNRCCFFVTRLVVSSETFNLPFLNMNININVNIPSLLSSQALTLLNRSVRNLPFPSMNINININNPSLYRRRR